MFNLLCALYESSSSINHCLCWLLLNKMCGEEVHYEDNIEQIPKLPKISNLKIKFGCEWSQGLAIGATAAKLIAKCSEIEDLSIETFYLVRLDGQVENHPHKAQMFYEIANSNIYNLHMFNTMKPKLYAYVWQNCRLTLKIVWIPTAYAMAQRAGRIRSCRLNTYER